MRFLFVFAVSFLIAGWWFIRNYIIYDGDILGRSTARYYAEMFAVESLKPSNRMTPLKLGYTLKYMLIDLNWIKLTCRSFFGVFGRMTIFLNDKIYYIYYTIFLSGLFGTFIKNRTRNKKFYLLYLCMITMCIITIGISIYYSFTSDMQPQGRYCFPMLIPLCYLITLGLDNIFNKLRGRFKILTLYSLYFCLFSLSLYSLFFVVIPIYY